MSGNGICYAVLCMLILFDLESLKGLLSVDYEVVGAANRASEEQTWIHFADFLDECEGTFTLSTQAQAVRCSYYFPYVCFMQLEKLTAQWKMCSCFFLEQTGFLHWALRSSPL